MYMFEIERTHFFRHWANLENIFKNCHHFTHKSVQKCNFGFYSITGNYTNEIRLKVCQKSNISEKKNMVANFGFNCKNGKVSPILRLHAITQVRITPKLNFCPKFCQKWSFKFNLIISNIWCQIVLVPNCPGAKLSTFIILVPNCSLLLSSCQIVPFIILVPNCPVPNCPVPNCPTIKIRYHIFHFKHIHPQNEKQKKTIFYFNENSNRFQS